MKAGPGGAFDAALASRSTQLVSADGLVLRVASVLHRSRAPQPMNQLPPITDGGLLVDLAARRAVPS
ncbi:MAG: hypothetical protein M3332_16440 [Actinomycetota bacterium]|nr:hypothetical protein [Actinomycetota bacterium]